MFEGEISAKLKIDNADFAFPRVTIFGRLGLSVEGHRGLLYFSENEVRFRIKRGALTISGEKLKLFEVDLASAVIEGSVKAVTYA